MPASNRVVAASNRIDRSEWAAGKFFEPGCAGSGRKLAGAVVDRNADSLPEIVRVMHLVMAAHVHGGRARVDRAEYVIDARYLKGRLFQRLQDAAFHQLWGRAGQGYRDHGEAFGHRRILGLGDQPERHHARYGERCRDTDTDTCAQRHHRTTLTRSPPLR